MVRFFDIFISTLILLIISPLFFFIAFILKFTGEGEIFYFQERVGKDNKNFNLIKFATMLKNSPNIGTGTLTVYNDPRVLKIGKFLRKTKINELPQLLNVFFGNMSLIGPRPLTRDKFSLYSEDIQQKIFEMKPGISGVGSIIFRDEEILLKKSKNPNELYKKIIIPYKGHLEIWYYNNKNLILYFALIFLTIIYILLPRNKLIWFFYNDIPKKPKIFEELLYK